MADELEVGGIRIKILMKDVKNVHLTVHPPDGRVRLTMPLRSKLEAVRLFVVSKLQWIRRQQQAMQVQEREPQREYLDRESHYVWGQRYLLRIEERDIAPFVELQHTELVLSVRPGTNEAKRQEIVALWYRDQLRQAVGPLMERWCRVLALANPRVLALTNPRLFVQHMKTKWGSCNPSGATIRLNTELAKKLPECLEYVLVHELVHLLEPTHNERFRNQMDQHMPHWRQLRCILNRAPLAHDDWEY